MKRKALTKLVAQLLNEMWAGQDNDAGAGGMGEVHRDNIDEFTNAYMNAALFTSTDNLEPNGGAPLDDKYTVEDLESSCFGKMAADCKDFQDKYRTLFERGGWSDEQAGHDFWLTRNGHGTGFWDRAYGKPNEKEVEVIGKALTQASKKYGEFNLYLCDGALDGLICGS